MESQVDKEIVAQHAQTESIAYSTVFVLFLLRQKSPGHHRVSEVSATLGLQRRGRDEWRGYWVCDLFPVAAGVDCESSDIAVHV
jgi:hypothetical protein